MVTSAVGITIGDPSGIGPEIVALAIRGSEPAARARLRLFGDRAVIDEAFERIDARLPGDVVVEDRDVVRRGQIVPGRPCEVGARAQVDYLEAAVRAARAGRIAGLVTAPISKTQAARAGFSFPGHTEYLADRLAGGGDVAMMFAGPALIVTLATVHVPLMRVGQLVTPELVARRVEQTFASLARDFGIARPRIGVVGLNPHAGEGGMFGREEIEAISPGIERARRALAGRAELSGPLVPDAAFRQAADGRHDALVAMYHDQALIAVKQVDFEDSVNVTLGLPIVRTSPDHGTAYDIAGTGAARAASFEAALRLAFRMVNAREESDQRSAVSGKPGTRGPC